MPRDRKTFSLKVSTEFKILADFKCDSIFVVIIVYRVLINSVLLRYNNLHR